MRPKEDVMPLASNISRRVQAAIAHGVKETASKTGDICEAGHGGLRKGEAQCSRYQSNKTRANAEIVRAARPGQCTAGNKRSDASQRPETIRRAGGNRGLCRRYEK